MPPHYAPVFKARVLVGQAEVARPAGDPRQSEQHLRAALRIYEDISMVRFAEQAKATLGNLTARAHDEP